MGRMSRVDPIFDLHVALFFPVRIRVLTSLVSRISFTNKRLFELVAIRC